jgi:glycerophosphoryl diester phosphodiesterase
MKKLPDSWFDRGALVIGHRGASHEAPENTMAAFQAAVAAGADGVELDVHLTSDGVPVVIHDARVDGTTDGTGLVNDLSLAEIRRLDAGSHSGATGGSHSGATGGSHSGATGAFAGELVPTLEEVLAAFGELLLINIELKGQVRPQAQAQLETTVADLVRGLNLQERVWVSSFKPYSLHRMRRVAPEIACGLLYSPLSLGAAWLAPITPFEALHPHLTLAPPWFVRLAHGMGKRVVVWTVDDVARGTSLLDAGVDALITNNPRAFKESRS